MAFQIIFGMFVSASFNVHVHVIAYLQRYTQAQYVLQRATWDPVVLNAKHSREAYGEFVIGRRVFRYGIPGL